jgi:hypothetical protein
MWPLIYRDLDPLMHFLSLCSFNINLNHSFIILLSSRLIFFLSFIIGLGKGERVESKGQERIQIPNYSALDLFESWYGNIILEVMFRWLGVGSLITLFWSLISLKNLVEKFPNLQNLDTMSPKISFLIAKWYVFRINGQNAPNGVSSTWKNHNIIQRDTSTSLTVLFDGWSISQNRSSVK